MSDDASIRQKVLEFAGPNGDYYADTFLEIQKSQLAMTHVNLAAIKGSFIWAAVWGNWFLFVLGFIVDLIFAVCLANAAKYGFAALDPATKGFLIERYWGWTWQYLIGAGFILIFGRLLLGWLADRIYVRQYERRFDRPANPTATDQRSK